MFQVRVGCRLLWLFRLYHRSDCAKQSFPNRLLTLLSCLYAVFVDPRITGPT
jgi:hypothetical protein